MNRQTLFYIGIIVAVICVIIALLYLTGATALGHHVKHAILFFGIALVAGLFAAVNRPLSTTP
jgi:flagellar motor component MotA